MKDMPSAKQQHASVIHPGDFEAHRHWYPKALNATIHPTVSFFLNLSTERMISRYCHLHPKVNPTRLRELLAFRCRHFMWAGADLLNVTSAGGKRQLVVIENNSCPSGQKSMPLLDETEEQGGYRRLIEKCFLPFIGKRGLPKGQLAVIYDKDPTEPPGYAAAMADLTGEEVLLAPFYENDPDPPVRFQDGLMEIRTAEDTWVPVRAAFRYITQRPWNRIPIQTKTRIFNPVLACIAGGRNKMVAAIAYEQFNALEKPKGLKINTPETIWDVTKQDIPGIVKKMGGHAVVKVPYSNSGQGVFTIVNSRELEEFMAADFDYDRYIVQSLIGNYNWSSKGAGGKLYHVGTIPSKQGKTYVADIRMMVCATEQGIRPLCVYARRTRKPLEDNISDGTESWDMLGTNLSVKNADGSWGTDTNRLILMDNKDFNRLGIGVDDLVEAFIQTVLSTIAIDQMADGLLNKQGRFRMKHFKTINNDKAFIKEMLPIV
jgi:hypothetical protein